MCQKILNNKNVRVYIYMYIYNIYRILYIYYIHIIYIPAEGKPRERFDWLLPGESQSPVIYNIKCSSDQFG